MTSTTTVTEAVINQLAERSHETATDKGFWEAPDPHLAEINQKLMLIVSEVAEAMEVLRRPYQGVVNPYSNMTDDQQVDFTEEIIDVVIRALDLVGHFAVNPGAVMLAKMEKNALRPRKHGKRY